MVPIIALLKHRVFVEGKLLGITLFDQMGVEVGKELANRSQPQSSNARHLPQIKNGSTAALVRLHRENTLTDDQSHFNFAKLNSGSVRGSAPPIPKPARRR